MSTPVHWPARRWAEGHAFLADHALAALAPLLNELGAALLRGVAADENTKVL
jgi:hypothetical protein